MSMNLIRSPYPVAGGGGFDPTIIAAGCTEWVSGDQSSLSSLLNNDPVSTWLDRVTGTRSWSGSGGARATFKTGGPNGLPYLSFDADDEMNWSNTISTLVSSTAYTMFVVIRPQRNGNNDDLFCPSILGGSAAVGLKLRNSGAGNKFALHHTSGTTTFIESTTTYSIGTWYILVAWYDGTNINIQVNEDTIVSTAKGSTGSLANTPNIGQFGLTADIAERVTYNVDIGSTDRGLVFDGLVGKYVF